MDQTTTLEHDGFIITSTDSAESMRESLGLPLLPQEAQAEARAVEEPTTEEAPAEEPAAEPEAEAPPEPPKKAAERDETGKFRAKDWKKRVDTVTWQRSQAQARAEAAEARVRELEAKLAPPPAAPAAPTFPAWEAWAAINAGKGYEDYVDARAEFKAEQKASQIIAQDRQRQQTEAAQAETQRTLARIAELGEAEYPDFRDAAVALAESGLPLSATVAGVIAESLSGDQPSGHRLFYHLATHPDFLRRVNGLHDAAAAYELGRMAAQLSAPAERGSGQATRPVSRAKPPIKPVGAGPAADVLTPPDDDEPIEAFVARRNDEDRKAGRL